MKSLEFKEQNTVYAKDQPQYTPLPAFINEEGDVATCWELTEEEQKQVADTGQIWLKMKTFKNPLQPIYSSVLKHEILGVEKHEGTAQEAKEILKKKGFEFKKDEIFQEYIKKIGDTGLELVLQIAPLQELFVWVPDTECGSQDGEGVRVVLNTDNIDKAISAAEIIAGVEMD